MGYGQIYLRAAHKQKKRQVYRPAFPAYFKQACLEIQMYFFVVEVHISLLWRTEAFNEIAKRGAQQEKRRECSEAHHSINLEELNLFALTLECP